MKTILIIIFAISTFLATAQNNRLVSSSNQWNTRLSFAFAGNTQTKKYTFSVDSFEMSGLYYRQLLFDNEESDAELAIFSPLGQLIFREKLAKGSKKYELGVESLPVGIYTLVLSHGGAALEYQRLIVTH